MGCRRLSGALPLALVEFDESALDRYGHCMSAVIGSELGQDVRHVVLDRFLCNRKLAGDLSITIAGRDEA